jgi:phosphatidylinositol alpha-1,6-mannosyltransferase
VDESYKGHAEMIACWPTVTAAVPGARLTFVGRGPRLDDLTARAAASPVADLIEVRGFVPDAELDNVYATASVFAMPSRGEGFGLVYVEAMRHRLPVVAGVHDAGAEVNVDGVTGFNVNLDRPGELPDRLIRLLADPTLAARFGTAGHDRWARHYRASAFDARMSAVLSDFFAGGGRHRPVAD